MFLIRSIDDPFIKWTDSVEELLEFISNTNKKRFSFKYKVKCSQTPADKHLTNIIGTKLIENGKMKRKTTNNTQGKCTQCLANNRTLRYKQVANTDTFRSNQTNGIFLIYQNCSSKYVIYVLECTKCKIQYVWEKLKMS